MNKHISVAILGADQAYNSLLRAVLANQPGIARVSVHLNDRDVVAARNGPAPDVLIVDISHVASPSLEFVNGLRSTFETAAMLIISEHQDEHRVLTTFRGGAAGFLVKQTALPKIGEALKEIRDGGCPISAQAARHIARWFHGRGPAEPKDAKLSARQEQILARVATGARNREIAAALDLSEATVRAHLRQIYNKLRVHSRAQAAARVRR